MTSVTYNLGCYMTAGQHSCNVPDSCSEGIQFESWLDPAILTDFMHISSIP